MNENNVIIKKNKGLIVIIFLLVVAVIGLGMYIILDKPEDKKCDTKEVEVSETKTENKVEEKKVDTEKILEEVEKVYKDVYSKVNASETFEYNKETLSQYFTEKALNRLDANNSNLRETVFFTGLFGSTDQAIRTLKIVEATEDFVIATGQNQASEHIDADNYPLYIIFTKVGENWKIDLFE